MLVLAVVGQEQKAEALQLKRYERRVRGVESTRVGDWPGWKKRQVSCARRWEILQ